MALFDVSKYEVPAIDEVDMKATRKNFETFMSAYCAAREKVGKNRMPKMTQSFSSIPSTSKKDYDGDAERFLIEREEFMPEYQELHSIFGQGYFRISSPLRDGATDRRRQLFMLRYVYGLNVNQIMQSTLLSKTYVVGESRAGFVQFCQELGILIKASETCPLVVPITKEFKNQCRQQSL